MIAQLHKIYTSSSRLPLLSFQRFKLYQNNVQYQNKITPIATFSSQSSSPSRGDGVKQQRGASGAAASVSASPTSHVIKSSPSDNNYSLGQTYHDFQCIRVDEIPEFNMQSYIFRHNRIGTELLYLKRDDPNNVFSINFRTTPFDSSGLPHILEHLVLCGSKRFPVRDPFFKMINRSVATFMNAMTGPDYTMYPFSTMNESDYYNLQRIYLDAVFRPNLNYLDFLQEGWRLEHKNNNDKNSSIQIKGVVYNEMKGAFSDNSQLFEQHLLNSILPHTYGFVSGGNPLEIPKLTHKNLIEFHQKYYHPSNCKIFCYGNMNLNKTLQYINDEYLNEYDNINTSYSRIQNHKRWIENRNVHVFSRYDNLGATIDKQNQIAITLLLSDITNVYETFLLNVITELLIKGPNSYFYKTLIEPNFSGGYNQVTGYTSTTKDTYFTVGLQDLKVDDFSRVQKLFDQTILNAIESGFTMDHIESVLHSIELSLKHQTPKFGLGLLFNLTPLSNHDGDIIDYLNCSKLINKLRKNIQDNPKYLQDKIERYFKNNTHKLILTMSPDDNYEQKFKEAEQMLIEEKLSILNDKQKDEIYENGIKLEKIQTNIEKDNESTNLLPCLNMNDISKLPSKLLNDNDLHVIRLNNLIPVNICTTDTNNIGYIKFIFDCCHINDEQIKLLPLFTYIITEMNTKNYDYREFNKLLQSKTSGINFDIHLSENIYNNKTYNLGILITSYALDKNVNVMFDLIGELLCNHEFKNVERIKMLCENYISTLTNGITQSGHMYAMRSSSGVITNATKLKSLLFGIEHINYMKNLLMNKNIENIIDDLNELSKNIFNINNIKKMRSSVNINDNLLQNFMNNYESFIKNLQCNLNVNYLDNSIHEKDIELLEPKCQHFIMNIPINYCAKSILTVPYIHCDHPSLKLLSKLLTSKYLLPTIRERNGAYGAGANIDINGIFSFYSYRDPNSDITLNTFDNTYKWLLDNISNSKIINEQTLFEAKLGVLQQLDMPVSPGNKDIDYFLYGISIDIQKKYRQRMLNVTINELKTVIDKYFKDESKYYGKCVLGPDNKDLSKRKNEKWTTVEGF